MGWFRKKRTGAVRRILDEIDIDIMSYIKEHNQVNMGMIKKHTKLSWSNLQVHKKRLASFLNMERQKDNSKIVSLNPDGIKLIEIFERNFKM